MYIKELVLLLINIVISEYFTTKEIIAEYIYFFLGTNCRTIWIWENVKNVKFWENTSNLYV